MKLPWTILAPEDSVHDPRMISLDERLLCASVISGEISVDKPVEVGDVEFEDTARREYARDLKENLLDLKKSKVFEYAEHKHAIKISVRKRQIPSVAYNIHEMAVRIVHVSVSVNIARLRVCS